MLRLLSTFGRKKLPNTPVIMSSITLPRVAQRPVDFACQNVYLTFQSRRFSKYEKQESFPTNLTEVVEMGKGVYDRWQRKRRVLSPYIGFFRRQFLWALVWDAIPRVHPKFDGTEFLEGAAEAFVQFQRAFHVRDEDFLRDICSERVFDAIRSTMWDLDATGMQVIASAENGGYSVKDCFISGVRFGGNPEDTKVRVYYNCYYLIVIIIIVIVCQVVWVMVDVVYDVEADLIMKDADGNVQGSGGPQRHTFTFEGCLRGQPLEWKVVDIPS